MSSCFAVIVVLCARHVILLTYSKHALILLKFPIKMSLCFAMIVVLCARSVILGIIINKVCEKLKLVQVFYKSSCWQEIIVFWGDKSIQSLEAKAFLKYGGQCAKWVHTLI